MRNGAVPAVTAQPVQFNPLFPDLVLVFEDEDGAMCSRVRIIQLTESPAKRTLCVYAFYRRSPDAGQDFASCWPYVALGLESTEESVSMLDYQVVAVVG